MQEREITCWPSPEQELLLRAALMQGNAALDAWNAWRARVELARLDPGSKNLLPLLWDNLRKQGVDPNDPSMKTLRRSYRLTLGKNRLLFHEIGRQLRALHDAAFPTMLLKGAALTLGFYNDYGLRPMGDFDILIPTVQTEDVIRFLEATGWHPLPRSPEAYTQSYRQVVHAHAFKSAGGWEFDLHWHVLEECCQPDADDDFWNGALQVDLDGVPTARLNPADQLLHVCVHGVRWNAIPPLRWVADAMTILNAPHASLDWDRLITQVEKRRLILPMRATLNYLRTLLDAPVPSAVLECLGNLPTSRLEDFEYQYKTRPYRDRALGYLPILWCKHSRLAGDIGLPAKFWRFIPFVQKFWGAEHWWQLPRFLVLMSTRRIQKVAENTGLDKLVKRAGRVRDVLKLGPYYRKRTAHELRDKQVIHLLHIGKTGGTSLKHVLEPVRNTAVYRMELHPHSFRLKDIPEGDKVVFFLRDPVKRFVSGFYSRKRMGQPRYNSPWNSSEEAVFMQFHTPNELARALSSKSQSTQEAAIRAMKSISHLKSSYWDWFENEAYFLSRLPDILFIGFQETLDEDFGILRKMLCLPETIALPKDEIRAHKNPPNLDTCLGEEALQNLREWYAADYEFIRLCQEQARQANYSHAFSSRWFSMGNVPE